MLNRMNTILISSLLGVATFVLQVAAFEGSLEARVSVRPPGPNVYLGECVLLQCAVESRCTFVKRYRWYRSKTAQAAPNPRHLVSGDRYFITAVTGDDAGRYWCQAECRENKTAFVVNARPVTLNVSELPPPSLSLTPNTGQMLRGEHFTVQCPASESDSSAWKLLHFPPGRTEGATHYTSHFSPPGGRVIAEAFAFVAASENSGLYWCEGAEGRSNAVNITVSYGDIILKTPALPVFTGDDVVLHCQYPTGNHKGTRFFKNGAEIDAKSSSSSAGVTEVTIKNVTREDEGFYKCAYRDRKMQSPESWLSVRPDRANSTSTEETPASTSGSWKWIIVSCGLVLLLLIPLTVWLVCQYRYGKLCTHSCWPGSKQDVPSEEQPATKQDATEVQWDLSWMEMSNLLDKELYRGT
ncbi:uncharacterized protein LOC118318553 isoform X1 [Scophthalmus maximus]|uniref:uncharacterized protein LOC118318553 isoform X1 n=1 Tax=Scophthalmus maximus TaxID=52904 RepID=UPI001FA8A699|nr:uncharacterized protein LOC118318553 isoform X1 [Scophthalmus maximus]